MIDPLVLGIYVTAAIAAALLGWQYAAAQAAGDVVTVDGRRPESATGLVRIALGLARMLAPLYRDAESKPGGQEVERMLRRAGRPFNLKAPEFLALRWVGAVAGGLLGWAFSVQATGGASPVYILMFTALGFFFPTMRLKETVKKRQLRIFRDLPYILDLLTLSTEAGQDFSSAMATVVEKGPAGPLVDEFRIAHQEVTLGKSRAEALRNMAARIDLPELTSFVLALIQAEQLGTSIGKVLRIMADQMRVKRSTIAEEMAGKVPVKLMLPLITLIFPAAFIVLFVPIYLHSQMSGGF